ncbi:MAG: hypothetical protein D6814_13505 [Calditrichaeota bacterium]|nr:MAG: hypothetical protein D6814_13505 [Calditrichota bacterium]
MKDKELCQICKKAIATVSITQVFDGKKQQWKLCEACAEEKGGMHSLAGLPEFFEKVVSNILGSEQEPQPRPEKDQRECPTCHITLSDFEKIGLLGCPDCYQAFWDELSVILRRIHGSNKHIGSRPRPQRVFGNVPDLDALKRELRFAIEQENYERAAEYRDMIRNLERELLREKASKETSE